jgi:hypothetical protein
MHNLLKTTRYRPLKYYVVFLALEATHGSVHIKQIDIVKLYILMLFICIWVVIKMIYSK